MCFLFPPPLLPGMGGGGGEGGVLRYTTTGLYSPHTVHNSVHIAALLHLAEHMVKAVTGNSELVLYCTQKLVVVVLPAHVIPLNTAYSYS